MKDLKSPRPLQGGNISLFGDSVEIHPYTFHKKTTILIIFNR